MAAMSTLLKKKEELVKELQSLVSLKLSVCKTGCFEINAQMSIPSSSGSLLVLLDVF